MGGDNYHLVEGPFKGKFTFKRVLPEDTDKVIQHIKDYFLRTEATGMLHGYTDEYGNEFEPLARQLIKEGLSFWVEDDESGDVAGVRVTFRHKRDTRFEGLTMNSKAFRELYRLVDTCHKEFDLFEHYGIEEYGDFFVASCAPKYRRQGITSEMYRRSVEFLRAEGFKMCKSVFTSPWTRRAALNLGFEEVYRIHYKDVRDDDGNLVYDKNQLTDEHYAALICKRL